MKTVLTIAGSDCSGGAGIQADIKTITVHKTYAMSIITAQTAQNTIGVYDILETPSEFIAKELDCIFEDIFPDAVKIGMVHSSEIIRVIAEKLKQYNAKNIVIDPVMISTSGRKFMDDNALQTYIKELLPIADIITPNIPEAVVLSGITIQNVDDMKTSAEKISEMLDGCVLIKGGHLIDTANDFLYTPAGCTLFTANRIENPNTHGTGCTLSSAIACNLANGDDMEESVRKAKDFISHILKSNLNLGKGNGPLDHCYYNYC